MSRNLSHHTEDDEPQAERRSNGAPRLPVERHVVASVLALEQIKSHAEQGLTAMRYFDFDTPSIPNHIHAIRASFDELVTAYNAYLDLISCEGQA